MSRSAVARWLGMLCCGLTSLLTQAQVLDLRGYTDATGAITVQYQGDTVDPYFALQALGVAQSHGLDISPYALAWARWLAQRYQEAGHIGRYCQSGVKPLTTWRWCKPPDADDSSLALWLHFLHRLPSSVRDQLPIDTLQARAAQDLRQLNNPATGLYHVSPHIRHSLFMDNLEVWSAALPRQHSSLAPAPRHALLPRCHRPDLPLAVGLSPAVRKCPSALHALDETAPCPVAGPKWS